MLADADAQPTTWSSRPPGRSSTEGDNRFGFGVFTVEREQITDAEVAIYAAPEPDGEARGPFPARAESLETEPAFTAETTAEDPDAAKAVYVTDMPLDEPGEWRLVALVDRDGELSRSADPEHHRSRGRPDPRPSATPRPTIHTPTADDVGRHRARSTPASRPTRCTRSTSPTSSARSRSCSSSRPPRSARAASAAPWSTSPSRSSASRGDDADFIHMEIYNDNNASKRLRPQVEAFGLPTEPWLFVIDRDGTVDTRIEGAFSAAELEAAIDRVADSC